jgi:hypothetical protein
MALCGGMISITLHTPLKLGCGRVLYTTPYSCPSDRLSAVLRHEINHCGITATHESRWSYSVTYNGQEVAA